MKERPFLFSGPMVRALLAGTKTQTRRVVKLPAEIAADPDDAGSADERNDMTCVAWLPEHEGGPGFYGWMAEYPEEGSSPIRCPYGRPGDRLWLREAFRLCAEADATPPRDTDAAYRIWYEADAPHQPGSGKLRPGMFMPRWASRLTLEITGVRVERLQDISEADAIAEGVVPMWEPGCSGRLMEALGGYSFRPAASAYALLWESINGPGSWDANPWVWCISFKVI